VELRRFFVENDCNMRRLLVEIIAQTALCEGDNEPRVRGRKP
jgi:hypothetical protein